MSTTGNRGFVFSFDLVIAFTAMLLMVSLVLMHSDSAARGQETALRRFASMQKMVFLMDSLVKNNDRENALLGSAVFNAELHRVESNILSSELLSAAKEREGSELSVSRIAFKTLGAEAEQIVFEQEAVGKNCLALDRFVLIDGKKALVEVRACN